MSRALIAALMVAAALVACNKSETGGGAGDDKFKIVVPSSADVKQGEVQTVRLTVDRGAGFKQDLKLELKAPKGLAVDPDSTTLKAADKGEVQLKITADKDAALGDQKIMVKGTPDKGEAANLEFKVTVSAK